MGRNRADNLKFGLYVPNFGRSSHPLTLTEMAVEAEKSGWDGFFLWDHLVEWDKGLPLSDSLTVLAAIAVKTEKIRIGTTLSPLPRYKPWTLARQTATLDQLSNGRLILSVGLGAVESCDYARFGEDPDNVVLAEKLDESLQIVTGLWSGKRFSFRGKHYHVGPSIFLPTLREGLPRPSDLKEIAAFIKKHRSIARSFDLVNIGWTTGANRRKDAERVAVFTEAGMTWWLESLYTQRDSPERMQARIIQGPPKKAIRR